MYKIILTTVSVMLGSVYEATAQDTSNFADYKADICTNIENLNKDANSEFRSFAIPNSRRGSSASRSRYTMDADPAFPFIEYCDIEFNKAGSSEASQTYTCFWQTDDPQVASFAISQLTETLETCTGVERFDTSDQMIDSPTEWSVHFTSKLQVDSALPMLTLDIFGECNFIGDGCEFSFSSAKD